MASGLTEGGTWNVTAYTDRAWSQTFQIEDAAGAAVAFTSPTTAVAQIRDAPGGTLITTMTAVVELSPAQVKVSLSEATLSTLTPGGYAWDLRVTEAGEAVPVITPSKFILKRSVTELP